MTCWFWHRWTIWGEPEKVAYRYAPGNDGIRYRQERTCTTCNLKERRWLDEEYR